MRPGGRALLAAGLLLALAPLPVRPALAVGQPGGGATLDCVPGPPTLIVTHGTLTRVNAGGTLSCPPPGAPPGRSFGPRDYPPPTPPTPGTACHMEFQSPMPMRLNGTTYEGDITDPQGNPPPTWADPGFQNLAVLPSQNDGLGRVQDLYMAAGTANVYTPWRFDGVWNAQGTQCVSTVPPSPQNPAPGWTSPCRIGGNATWPACLVLRPVVVVGPAAGVPVAVLGENLAALVQGRYTGGDIASLPAAPLHPGLTNLATCFSIGNMTVDGQAANPQLPTVWEKVVVGPNAVDNQGRHIVYVFRVTVSYQETLWDFGDGTQPAVPIGGQSPELGGAALCPQVPDPGQQFVAAHVYHRYSSGDGFHVTVTHRYGIRVTEDWLDSAGSHHVDVPTGIGPVDVPGLPQPYFAMPILQEEGVPVAG